MKLYHGTSKTALVHIVDEGLKPRGDNRGNWDLEVDSHPEAVYLTDAYALHFAKCAAGVRSDHEIAIVEIDTDHPSLEDWLFAPDEDFMEQATRKNPQFKFLKRKCGTDMVKRTAYFRERCLNEYNHYWEMTLKNLGTCAYYGHIPVEAITRYALLPINHRLGMASDPTITLANYKLMGHYYRSLTRMVFGDDIEDPTADPYSGLNMDRLEAVVRLSKAGVRVFTRDPSNPLNFTATGPVSGPVATKPSFTPENGCGRR